MTNKQNPRDKQAPHTGKVENDSSNQSQSRRGPVGTPGR